jgi:hypothetical protein
VEGCAERERLLVVPVHDFLEEEAMLDGALQHVEEGHMR